MKLLLLLALVSVTYSYRMPLPYGTGFPSKEHSWWPKPKPLREASIEPVRGHDADTVNEELDDAWKSKNLVDAIINLIDNRKENVLISIERLKSLFRSRLI